MDAQNNLIVLEDNISSKMDIYNNLIKVKNDIYTIRVTYVSNVIDRDGAHAKWNANISIGSVSKSCYSAIYGYGCRKDDYIVCLRNAICHNTYVANYMEFDILIIFQVTTDEFSYCCRLLIPHI